MGKSSKSAGFKGSSKFFLGTSLVLFLVALPVTLLASRQTTQTQQHASGPSVVSCVKNGVQGACATQAVCPAGYHHEGNYNPSQSTCKDPNGDINDCCLPDQQHTAPQKAPVDNSNTQSAPVSPQCGNCSSGGSCGTVGQYCEKQVGCHDVGVAVNQVYQCQSNKTWGFKYNQNGGSCTAQNCGNKCDQGTDCAAGKSCSVNGQYCEHQISCSGTTPVNQVFQCGGGTWQFKYNQNGGSCTRNCTGSTAAAPTQPPYRNFGTCAGLTTSQSLCTDAGNCKDTSFPYEHSSSACSGTNNGKMVRCCVSSGQGGYTNFGTCAGLSASQSVCTDAPSCSNTNFPYPHTSSACGGTNNGKPIHCCASQPG